MNTLSTSALAVALLVATKSAAQSPPEFLPHVGNALGVAFQGFNVSPAGISVPSNIVSQAPDLNYSSATNATYLAIAMDFSLKVPNVPHNTTLLHWVQPDFHSAGNSLTTSAKPLAPFYPIEPPAGSMHSYGVFLYAQPSANFTVPQRFQAYFANITSSVSNRVGSQFDLDRFVAAAGLTGPLAADWFHVTASRQNSTQGTSTASSGASSSSTAAASSLAGSLTSSSTPSSTPSNPPASLSGVDQIHLSKTLRGLIATALLLLSM